MSMRIILVRFAAVSLFGTGLALSALVRTDPAAAGPPATTRTPISSVVAPLTVVTLPTIYVRPAMIDNLKARQRQAMLVSLPNSGGENSTTSSSHVERSASALPPLRLDMPYYSFGKTTSHLGKD